MPTLPPHLSNLFQSGSKKIIARCQWVAVLTVLAVGLWYDAALLTRYPVAAGLDGYYYVLQVDALRDHGRLYFPTNTPLVLYALVGLSYLTGSTVLAIKIGSVMLHALLCLGICAVIISVTHRAWLGALGGFLAEASGLHVYMIAEFISYLGAVTLLVWCGWCAIRATQTRRVVWVYASIGCLIAAVFSHRSALAMSVVTAAIISLLRWTAASHMTKWYWPAVLLAPLASWCAPIILALQPLTLLPPGLSGQLTTTPRWPGDSSNFPEVLVLSVASPLALLLINRTRRQTMSLIPSLVLGSVALWSLTVTLNPFLAYDAKLLGLTWRLRSLAYIQVAVLVPGLIWLVFTTSKEAVPYVAAPALALAILSVRAPLPQGMRPYYLTNREQVIQNLPPHRQQLGPKPIIIARHGDQFVVTSTLGTPSQQTWPEDNQYQPVYWLLHQVDGRLLSPSMIVLATDNDHSYTVLVDDNRLQQQLKSVTEDERLSLFAVNPHLYKYEFR